MDLKRFSRGDYAEFDSVAYRMLKINQSNSTMSE